MRVVVVADTHSAPHPETATRLRELRPDAVLHAGDIGDLGVLDTLAETAPVLAVRGNIDANAPGLPDLMTIDVTQADKTIARLLLLHIAVQGPKLRVDVARVAHEAGASLVVCGHSHVPFIGRDRGLTVFNPGSIGPRRFALPIVFGTVEIANGSMRLAHIDCATGRPWMPPALR